MSKRAEQKALEAYPISRLPFFPGSVASYDTNEEKRMIYEESYEQAEKDTIERVCEWLKKNATYIHPRKGIKTCMINLNVLREAILEEKV